MVEVRFQSEADCVTWNQSARAEALVGPRLARLVSLCLQQLSALDSSEDIVHLPFPLTLDDGALHFDIDGEATIVARVQPRAGNVARQTVVIERVIAS